MNEFKLLLVILRKLKTAVEKKQDHVENIRDNYDNHDMTRMTLAMSR